MIQNWEKLGLIFDPQEHLGKDYRYAALPLAYHLFGDVYRIIYSARPSDNRSIPFCFDYDIVAKKIVGVNKTPLLNIESIGSFDEDGIMPCSLLKQDDKYWLYYIGWNRTVSVPFRNSLGLATSNDGIHFKRISEGPILDRCMIDPYFVASCEVLNENGIWRMYYLSGLRWIKTETGLKHYYLIKYAESRDGIIWNRNNEIAIPFKNDEEFALSVPRVIKEDNIYKMWYSYRASEISYEYLIGYAESTDGKSWIRKDEAVNMTPSKEGWDSVMICYPYIINHKSEKYMLYNGNNYGQTGIGLARLRE